MVNATTCGKTKLQAGILEILGDEFGPPEGNRQSFMHGMTCPYRGGTIIARGVAGDVNEP